MARPKGSKNKPRSLAKITAAGTNRVSRRSISIDLSDEMILQHFSAQELLELASRKLRREGNIPAVLATASSGVSATSRKPRRRRKFSAEARAKMAEAQRKRWAKARK